MAGGQQSDCVAGVAVTPKPSPCGRWSRRVAQQHEFLEEVADDVSVLGRQAAGGGGLAVLIEELVQRFVPGRADARQMSLAKNEPKNAFSRMADGSQASTLPQ